MILVISISIVGITRGTYMTYINTVRHEENEQVYQHLVAIRKIVAYKSMRNGADKAVAELLLNGIFQFSFKDGLEAFSLASFKGGLKRFEQDAVVECRTVDMSATVIHKENRDLVRHLIAIRNIRNTKCARCDFFNCQGCYLSGREDFNIGSALKLIMLYDWKAIYEVLGIGGYYDETNNFVNKLADDTVANVAQIKIAKPEYETNY